MSRFQDILKEELNKVEQSNQNSIENSGRFNQILQEELSSSNQGPISNQSNIPQLSVRPDRSAISNLERLHLSFADTEGKEAYLRNKFQFVERLPNGKFAVGSDITNLQPIDPDTGFQEIMGDLADIVGEIPVIAAQMVGGAIGTGVSPGVGTVVGGGLGAGVGEAAKIGIGKALGVQEGQAREDATDIAISAAFGTAGEILAKGTAIAARGAKKVIAPKLAKILQKGAATQAKKRGVSPENTLLANATKKSANILANVPEDSTNVVFKNGVEKVLGNPMNLRKDTVVPLSQELKEVLKVAKNLKGKSVEEATDRLISKSADKIDITPLYNQLRRDFMDLGLLDDAGNIIRTAPGKENLTFARRLLSNVKGSGKPLTEFPEEEIKVSMKQMIGLRRQLGDKFSGLTPKFQNAVGKFVKGSDDMPGIKQITDDIAKQVGSEDYIRANAEFSAMMDIYESLNLTKKTDVNSLEKVIKGLEKLGENQKVSFENLRQMLPNNGELLTRIENWNAAQDFVSARPDILRFSAITGILAGLTGFETRESKVGTLAGAIALGTPAGQRFLIRGAAKLGKVPKSILTQTGRGVTLSEKTELTPALLGRLLQTTTVENRRKSTEQRTQQNQL